MTLLCEWHPRIQWEDTGNTRVTWLDWELWYTNTLEYRLCQKPMNKYLDIPMDSNHPKATLAGFIVGEKLLIVRRNKHEHDVNEALRLFAARLRERGYTNSFIKQSWIQRRRHAQDDVKQFYFGLRYNHGIQKRHIQRILNKHNWLLKKTFEQTSNYTWFGKFTTASSDETIPVLGNHGTDQSWVGRGMGLVFLWVTTIIHVLLVSFSIQSELTIALAHDSCVCSVCR